MDIGKILKWLWDNRTTILLIGAVIFALLFFIQCDRTNILKDEAKFEKKRQVQNLKALTDSIDMYVNDAGDTSYQKPIAEMTTEEIKENLPSVYKAIVDTGSEVKVIIKWRTKYVGSGSVDNTIGELEKYNYSLKFDYVSDDSLLTLKGKSAFKAFPYIADSDVCIVVSLASTHLLTLSVSYLPVDLSTVSGL